jgi:peptidoglycan/LPS O-acetylase OafA/YrhL
MAMTLACATASYYLLERPILRFKKRFERVGSAPAISP